ncbi:MAG: hypothetical protein EOP86_17065, partial [Verrucomicrobiaceae bacterium]
MSEADSSPPAGAPSSTRMTTGCFMLVLVACWLLALGVWMIWHVYAQVREMRTFTQSTAQVIH